MIIRKHEHEFYNRYYMQLVGAKIDSYGWTLEENPVPVFKAILATGENVIITLSSSPDENEAGFLYIEDEDFVNRVYYPNKWNFVFDADGNVPRRTFRRAEREAALGRMELEA